MSNFLHLFIILFPIFFFCYFFCILCYSSLCSNIIIMLCRLNIVIFEDEERHKLVKLINKRKFVKWNCMDYQDEVHIVHISWIKLWLESRNGWGCMNKIYLWMTIWIIKKLKNVQPRLRVGNTWVDLLFRQQTREKVKQITVLRWVLSFHIFQFQ